jgi:pimeloyl-ACP methyl ester carboxylesterase
MYHSGNAAATNEAMDAKKYRLNHRRRPIDVWVAGEGPPLVLLHGFGLSGAAYRSAMSALAARGVRVVAPSLAVGDGAWSLSDVSERAVEAMASFDVSRAPVVAHSFGGAVSVRLAVDHPDFVKALVLVNTVGISPGVLRFARMALPGRQWRVAANLPTARALLGTATARGAVRHLAQAARWILSSGLEEELVTLKHWATPSVVLWASRDTLLPRDMGEREAELLGCRFVEIEATDDWPLRRPPDHDWPFRAPNFFAARVLAEIESLAPRAE